jgi:hypothetical protein
MAFEPWHYDGWPRSLRCVNRKFNEAFVLTQYFGYLRRNPADAPEQNLNFDGYNFWLSKLNQFHGNFGRPRW